MSLRIYYSDRIEDLAEHLKGRLLGERKDCDPFAFSQVVVPNTNIAKWLQIRVFAKEQTLCAGIKFPFIEQRLTELMSANLPSATAFSLLPMNAYANGIMSALLATKDSLAEFDSLAPLRAYISGGDGDDELKITTRRQARMAWQLAVKMANLMDQYEVRRPEIVERWLAGGGGGGSGAPPLVPRRSVPAGRRQALASPALRPRLRKPAQWQPTDDLLLRAFHPFASPGEDTRVARSHP